ncbi:MAG: peptidoglycan-binding protein LysM [Robiginitomaculum sp.]|nr:MAG: peptidoglycan-binding protein LysM [Robiginitomaculum sp.]
MNLITFAASVGRKLGIGKGKEKDEAALRAEVEKLGLATQNINIEVEGETVKVTGKTTSQAEKEKILIALGNVQGIGNVEDHLEVEEPAPEAAYHTVIRGDTLWAISKKHYKAGSKYMLIFEANTPMLEHPDRIYIGQVLRIPPLEAKST